MSLKPPIFVVGATRSGTTMLMEVLGSAPGLCFMQEQITLWRVGHAYRSHDAAVAADAKPWVKRWIRRRLLKHQERNEGRRVVDKLPTNVLRIPFIHAVFPESKIIHIYRDGRANLRSQVEQFEQFFGYRLLNTRGFQHLQIRMADTPFWEWPAYAPKVLRGMARRYIGGKDGIEWFGVRYPGWQNDLGRLTTAQIAGKQWVYCVETGLRDLETLPAGTALALRYDEVVTDPGYWFQRIADFCEVPITEEYLASVRQRVHANSRTRWVRELEPALLHEAMPIIGPLLDKLGFPSSESIMSEAGVGAGTTK